MRLDLFEVTVGGLFDRDLLLAEFDENVGGPDPTKPDPATWGTGPQAAKAHRAMMARHAPPAPREAMGK